MRFLVPLLVSLVVTSRVAAVSPEADLHLAFTGVALAAFADEVETERPNRVGLFLGATTRSGETRFAFGFEYERRISELIGLGAVAEWTPNFREAVLAAPIVFFHPYEGLVLSVAPGIEFEDGGKFLIRFGAGWDFELVDGWSIGPAVSLDVVSRDKIAFVWGFMTSYAF